MGSSRTATARDVELVMVCVSCVRRSGPGRARSELARDRRPDDIASPKGNGPRECQRANLHGGAARLLGSRAPLLPLGARSVRAASRLRGSRPLGADRSAEDRGGAADALRPGEAAGVAEAQPGEGATNRAAID